MTKHRSRARRSRALGAGVVSLAGVASYALIASPALADETDTNYVFRGSASAIGFQWIYKSPGFAATDTPVNSGGPTATIDVDSLGSSLGYAALPDPGQFVTTLPGTGAGLFSTGAAGLPPIQVPTPPGYPFFVSTDATTNPTAQIGEGPYSISSDSKNGSGHAAAIGGFQVSAVGNASYAKSTASVGPDAGSIVATASSKLQGLAIGPVTIGEVVSTATEQLNPDGKLVPSSALQVSMMRIGGLPVSFTHDQVNFPGPSYPVPMNDSMKQILQASGITMEVVTAKVTKTSVTAPALIITAPAAVPGLTDGGTTTFVIGGSLATMDGSATTAAQTGSTGTAGTAGSSGMPASTASTGSPAVDAAGLNAAGLLPATAAGATPDSAAPAMAPAQNTITFSAAAGPGRLVGLFDTDLMYLLVAIGAIAVLGLGQLIGFVGVRRQWNSGVG